MPDRNQRYFNYLGWIGGSVALAAYGLITQQVISSKSLIFLLMNTFACSSLICYSFQKKAFANLTINSVHLLITLIAIGRWALK